MKNNNDHKMLDKQGQKQLLMRLTLALECSQIGIWDWDIKSNLTTWDNTMFEIYGIEKVIPMPYELWLNTVIPEDREVAVASLEYVIANKTKHSVDFRISRPDGSLRYIHAAQGVICDSAGNVINVVGVNMDITQSKENELKLREANEKLDKLAKLDPLTGIANRRAFSERLEHELQISHQTNTPLSLLMIDIDFFKQYNDNYGHVQGDTILKTVSDIITQSIHRTTDFVARYGGEEFVVLLPNTTIESAIHISKRLTAKLHSIGIKHAFSEISDLLTLSIGASSTEINSIDLVNFADKALYKAKKSGRNKIEVYTKK